MQSVVRQGRIWTHCRSGDPMIDGIRVPGQPRFCAFANLALTSLTEFHRDWHFDVEDWHWLGRQIAQLVGSFELYYYYCRGRCVPDHCAALPTTPGPLSEIAIKVQIALLFDTATVPKWLGVSARPIRATVTTWMAAAFKVRVQTEPMTARPSWAFGAGWHGPPEKRENL